MEKIQLGQYKVAEKWEDVKLLQWQEYIKKNAESKDGEVDVISTLECFSDIPRDIIMQMPTDMFEAVIERLKWVREDKKPEPTNKIVIDGEEYIINVMEKLKVKEYLDVNTVLESDKYNYAMLFAILCRKVNEQYDEEFIADKLSDRIEMFENIEALKAMGLIAFFLSLYIELGKHSLSSSMVQGLKAEAQELVKSIKNSLKPMDYIIPSKVRQILTLRKLEKSLKNI